MRKNSKPWARCPQGIEMSNIFILQGWWGRRMSPVLWNKPALPGTTASLLGIRLHPQHFTQTRDHTFGRYYRDEQNSEPLLKELNERDKVRIQITRKPEFLGSYTHLLTQDLQLLAKSSTFSTSGSLEGMGLQLWE